MTEWNEAKVICSEYFLIIVNTEVILKFLIDTNSFDSIY